MLSTVQCHLAFVIVIIVIVFINLIIILPNNDVIIYCSVASCLLSVCVWSCSISATTTRPGSTSRSANTVTSAKSMIVPRGVQRLKGRTHWGLNDFDFYHSITVRNVTPTAPRSFFCNRFTQSVRSYSWLAERISLLGALIDSPRCKKMSFKVYKKCVVLF